MQLTASPLRVNTIVGEALAKARITSEFIPINAYMEAIGVQELNIVLARFNMTALKSPFYYDITFNLVPNQNKYYIGFGPLADVVAPYMRDVAFINLLFTGLLYPVTIISDLEALYTVVQTDIVFLPAKARIYFENDSLGETYTVLNFLNAPDQPYPCQLRGKPYVPQVVFSDTIRVLPEYYYEYLVMETAFLLAIREGRDDVLNSESFIMHRQQISNEIASSTEKDLEALTGQALLPQNRYIWGSRLGVRT